MPAKVTPVLREFTRLTRILEALEQELLDASDAEILQAAQELGMNPHMRGSAAFIGLKYPTRWQLQDFFELARGAVAAQGESQSVGTTPAAPPRRNGRRAKGRDTARDRKDSGKD
jgi:hypothetical protein